MRIRDWYFQGWERRRDDSGKTVFVYTGEYYRLPEKIKPPVLSLAAALIALYLAVALLPSPGGMWRLAAIPQLLELLPLLYLIIGALCLLRVKDPLTFRDYYASWRRLKLGALWSLFLTALMAAAEIAYLVLFPGEYALSRELPYLLGELGCAALSAVLFLYLRRHPCLPSSEGPKKE